MTFNRLGEPVCDTCQISAGCGLESSLAMGWGYWRGQDGAGREVEYSICRKCRGETHKRPKFRKPEQDDTLF